MQKFKSDLTFSSSSARLEADLSGLLIDSRDSNTEVLPGLSPPVGYLASDRQFKQSSIGFTNRLTSATSTRALETVISRIEDLFALEGRIGALESRLKVAQTVLGASAENFAAASSRIKDADIAAESANVVRTQILQQTTASLLGQANVAPQIGLQLLQNA